MKPSKYSKRRPVEGKSFRERDLKKPDAVKALNASVSTRSSHKSFPKIKEYDLGIFVDDERQMDEVALPEAKQWIVLRSYVELHDWLDTEPFEGVNSVCVSFDHYMGRNNGNDCMFLLSELLPENIRVDIGGHSSDPSMNVYKRDFWATQTNYGTTFTLNG